MRPNKRWMIAGAAVGLVSAIGIQAYGLMLGHVPPVLVFLFWPSGFIVGFYYPTAPIILPAILGNVLMFSAVAAVLGSRFLLLLTVVVIVAWWALPPSDGRLTRQFCQRQSSFEHLDEMSKQDSRIVRICGNEVETDSLRCCWRNTRSRSR